VRHGAAQQGRRAEGVAHPRLERGQRRVERGGGERRGGRGTRVGREGGDEEQEDEEDRWWRWSRHCWVAAALGEAPGSGESGGGCGRGGGGPGAGRSLTR
jgi:hypothetical protein